SDVNGEPASRARQVAARRLAYVAFALATSSAGRTALAQGVAAAAPAFDGPAPVLHLDDAVKTGLSHQPNVVVARAQTEAAAGRVDQARAGYLPQVTGTALAERVHGSTSVRTSQGALPTTVGASGVTYNVFSFGVSASQLIWDFGQTIDRTRAASAVRESQESNERTARFEAALAIRQAFFQAHAQRSLVQVGQDSVTNMERHLEQIKGFVEQGIRPDIDLAQARTDLANARVTLINAQNGYATAKAQLNQAMGVAQGTDYEVADEGLAPIPGEDGGGDALLKQALASRPELVTYQKQAKAAELTVSALRGAYGPTLAGIGGVSEAGPALDQLGLNWNIGLNLTWPIFQGGLTRGEVREARANVSVAQAQLTQAVLNVRLQVEQARLNLRSAKASIEAAKDARENAQERLRLAEGRYEAGVGSIIELDDAAVAALAAGAQLVQAEYNLAAARAGLLAALGK
ncbi:MAG TPA: TolC family protein, partial [Polyangiaceae bacterium]|nr:TolC family protein [Polyangiaceae bacterium]